jgi:nitrile hydratase subunit beta
MNGIHDMGGVHGFGTVVVEADEPVFHANWERRAFALTLAMAALGRWNIDMSRSAREQRSAADYLSRSYYELWLDGLERLVIATDLAAPEEIAAGRMMRAAAPLQAIKADDVAGLLSRGGPTQRPPGRPALFGPGDRARARNIHPATHTRLPRYVRGHVGVIECVHGCHVFPDSRAAGGGEDPQWLYAICFDGRELWGADSDPQLKISVDAFESYLEPA